MRAGRLGARREGAEAGTELAHDRPALGEPGVRGGVGGVDLDRLLEAGDRLLEAVERPLAPVVAPLEISLEHFRRHRFGRRQLLVVGGGEPAADLARHRARHLALHRQHVADVALVALRPEVLLGVGADELQRDAHAVAGAQHRALQDVVDAELAGDLGEQLVRAAVAHHRLPRDDAQRAHLGDGGDQLLGEPLDEVVGAAAEVGERQHRQRRRGARVRDAAGDAAGEAALGDADARHRLGDGALEPFVGRRRGRFAAHRVEVAAELLGGAVAQLDGLLQAAVDERTQATGQLAPQGVGEGRLVAQDGGEHLRRRAALERVAAGRHLEEHDAERKDVGARVHRLAARLLGGHVAGGAEHRPLLGQVAAGAAAGDLGLVVAADRLGDAEVEHLDAAVAGDHHVVGLEVAVEDALAVRRGERVHQRRGDGEEALELDPVARDEALEGLALDQLHGEEVAAVGLLDRVDGDDVGVVEGGDRPRLAHEALPASRVARHLLGQHFEGDLALELGVEGEEHLPHAPFAELGEHPVVQQAVTDHGRRAAIVTKVRRDL